MRCRIGYWKTGLGVQLDQEAFETVRRTGKGLKATLLPNRRILLVGSRSAGGHKALSKVSPAGRAKRPTGIYAEAEVHLDTILARMDSGLPLFEVHELAVDYDFAEDGLVTEPLAADHDLPWPDARKHLSAEELRHQCYLRCRSHMLAGGHGYFDEIGVPAEVVRMMAGGFVLARDKARAELDIAGVVA